MRISGIYMPLKKESPSNAVLSSHSLMLRSGMIRQHFNGLYVFLPLAIRVLNKIQSTIRSELEFLNASEVIMPTIQSASLWKKSNRFNSYGEEMLKISDRHGRDLIYSPTSEELAVDMFSQDIKSYKDLPINIYQINWKFRDEISPRNGLMRAREFLMLDAYSFDNTEQDSRKTYNLYYQAFINIFKKLRLPIAITKADTGEIGGDLSHEFHVLSDYGDSDLVAIKNENDEEIWYTKEEAEKETPNTKLELSAKGIEVGHIFNFGNKYTKALNKQIQTSDNSLIHPLMGSYGLGITRILAAAIEASHDDKGIVWNSALTPYEMLLINLSPKNEKIRNFMDNLYQNSKISLLYEDTEDSLGQKLNKADLIGIPYQIICGNRSFENNCLEVKHRKSGEKIELTLQKITNFITNYKIEAGEITVNNVKIDFDDHNKIFAALQSIE